MLIALSAFVYLLASAICLGAAWSAARSPAPRWHSLFWAAAALFFTCLVVMRIAGTEETLRAGLRHDLSAAGAYGRRRAVQKIFAGAVMLGALAALVVLVRAWFLSRRTELRRALVTASAGLGAMTALVTLRVISFHQTDWLLYGPLHLNWFADSAATLLVVAAGWRYRSEVRRRLAVM